jgi:hypothetical protein
MKKQIILLIILMAVNVSFGQKKKPTPLHLTNALVVGQMDKPEDRYSIEINLAEMLSSRGVTTSPSLNVIKMGSDSQELASDSIKNVVKAKGIDTYVLVSVRGYDRRFKVSEKQDDLKGALSIGSLFELYRSDIVSVSFEFKFFRNGEFVYGDIVKCGNVSDRETVLKRFRKKVGKRISKKWMK